MKRFECVVGFDKWHVNGRLGLSEAESERLLPAITVVEDGCRALSCNLAATGWLSTHLCEGRRSLKMTAALGNYKIGECGKVRASLVRDNPVALALFRELQERQPQFASDAWYQEFVRGLRVEKEQAVETSLIGECRYEVRLDGVVAGWLLGGSRRYAVEWCRGSLGTVRTLHDGARMISEAWE